MAKKAIRVRERTSYAVGAGTRDITASVDVGLGQTGSVTMLLKGKTVIEDKEAPVAPQTLGKGSDLAGQLLRIEVVVTDVAVMANKMKVVVKLGGGSTAKRVEATAEVQDIGDTAFFEIAVLLKE
jgi:hypothetical protein